MPCCVTSDPCCTCVCVCVCVQEMLTQQTLKCSDVQTQLDMARTSVEQLRSKVGELEECNASLHSENVELHSTATSGPSYR